MTEVVVCRYCGEREYYREMRWLGGKCLCRDCYKAEYERVTGERYIWNDLKGARPGDE